jgi:hypothetical protein
VELDSVLPFGKTESESQSREAQNYVPIYKLPLPRFVHVQLRKGKKEGGQKGRRKGTSGQIDMIGKMRGQTEPDSVLPFGQKELDSVLPFGQTESESQSREALRSKAPSIFGFRFAIWQNGI